MHKVLHVHIHSPSDAMGTRKTLIAGPHFSLEESLYGIICTSKTSSKSFVVPYANIKSYEIAVEAAPTEKAKK